MRIPRLYVDQPLASGADCPLDRRALDHAVKVLRLRAGDPLCLFNGHGGEFAAVLARGAGGALLAQVGEFSPDRRESPLSVMPHSTAVNTGVLPPGSRPMRA